MRNKILTTTLALLAAGILLVYQAYPSREAVRVRNSLLASIAAAEEFSWSPKNAPADFLQNDLAPSTFFRDRVAEAVHPNISDFDKAKNLAAHLIEGHRRGVPIQANTEKTYRVIRERGIGYCADFTQTYIALALAADVSVREWGVSFDGFGGDGHAFNEFYDPELKAWVMVDSFNAFYPVNAISGRPLSAMEFIENLEADNVLDLMRFVPTNPDQFRFRSDKRLVEYYRQGLGQFYLWWGNNVYDYDSHALVAWAGKFSRSAEQVVAIILGVHPRIRILATADSEDLVRALSIKRWIVLSLTTICCVLGMRLLFLVFRAWVGQSKS